jgi:hypothetical protein
MAFNILREVFLNLVKLFFYDFSFGIALAGNIKRSLFFSSPTFITAPHKSNYQQGDREDPEYHHEEDDDRQDNPPGGPIINHHIPPKSEYFFASYDFVKPHIHINIY